MKPTTDLEHEKMSQATNTPTSVWLIEDNHTFRKTVARVLNRIPGMDWPQSFPNAEDAIEEDCTLFEMTNPYLVQRWLGK